MMAQVRQKPAAKQTEIYTGVCNHLETEAVVNYAGAVIAWQCRGCTLVTAHEGVCAGCGETGKLTKFSSKRRYCTELCLKKARARARKAANEGVK